MAVVTTKSLNITNRDASIKVLNNPAIVGGLVKGAAGTVEAVSGDSIASKYIMFQIPSNAAVHSLRLLCDAITACAGDIGLYRTTADGGAVVAVAFFASAQSLASAIVLGTEVSTEAGAGSTADVANVEKPIWSRLGLTSDPGIMYDVVITLTAAAGSAGTISLDCLYKN